MVFGDHHEVTPVPSREGAGELRPVRCAPHGLLACRPKGIFEVTQGLVGRGNNLSFCLTKREMLGVIQFVCHAPHFLVSSAPLYELHRDNHRIIKNT